jgi:hypothetical protein
MTIGKLVNPNLNGGVAQLRFQKGDHDHRQELKIQVKKKFVDFFQESRSL